jgi:hypothetical protein
MIIILTSVSTPKEISPYHKAILQSLKDWVPLFRSPEAKSRTIEELASIFSTWTYSWRALPGKRSRKGIQEPQE